MDKGMEMGERKRGYVGFWTREFFNLEAELRKNITPER